MTASDTVVSPSTGSTNLLNQFSRRKSPKLHIDISKPSTRADTQSESGTPSAGVWYRPELPEEDIPLNLGAETSWDGTRGISVAQGRQRSNTVVGATFASLGTSPSSMTGLGLYSRDAEEPLQPPPNPEGISSAYGCQPPRGAEFDDELTRRLLREKRHLTEEGRWVDDGDIGNIVSRRAVPEDLETASNLLCNICFQNLGDTCFTRCRHIFCSSDLDEHIRRSLRPETLELACPACGTSCTYGRDIISVATGRPTGQMLPFDAQHQPFDIHQPLAKRPSSTIPQAAYILPTSSRDAQGLTLKSIKQRSTDHTKKGKAPHLPSPPITPAPSLPTSLYEQRTISEKSRPNEEDLWSGLVATVERAFGEQFGRVFSVLAFALVLWVLVK